MKAFGLTALILSVIGIFIPVVGYFIAGLSGILAIFSAGKGTTLGLTAVFLNIVNIIFLSPSLIMSATENDPKYASLQSDSKTIFFALLIIQIVALLVIFIKWFKTRKIEAI